MLILSHYESSPCIFGTYKAIMSCQVMEGQETSKSNIISVSMSKVTLTFFQHVYDLYHALLVK